MEVLARRFGRMDSIVWMGWSVLLGCYVVVLLTFVAAWLSGGSLLITINDYGEGLLEALLLGASIPVVWLFWRQKGEKREKRRIGVV